MSSASVDTSRVAPIACDAREDLLDFKLLDTSLLKFWPDFPDKKTAIIMNIFPSVTVQQISNTLATRQLRPKEWTASSSCGPSSASRTTHRK